MQPPSPIPAPPDPPGQPAGDGGPPGEPRPWPLWWVVVAIVGYFVLREVADAIWAWWQGRAS